MYCRLFWNDAAIVRSREVTKIVPERRVVEDGSAQNSKDTRRRLVTKKCFRVHESSGVLENFLSDIFSGREN